MLEHHHRDIETRVSRSLHATLRWQLQQVGPRKPLGTLRAGCYYHKQGCECYYGLPASLPIAANRHSPYSSSSLLLFFLSTALLLLLMLLEALGHQAFHALHSRAHRDAATPSTNRDSCFLFPKLTFLTGIISFWSTVRVSGIFFFFFFFFKIQPTSAFSSSSASYSLETRIVHRPRWNVVIISSVYNFSLQTCEREKRLSIHYAIFRSAARLLLHVSGLHPCSALAV